MVAPESAPVRREDVFRFIKTYLFGFEGTTIGEILNLGKYFKDVTEDENFALPKEAKIDKSFYFETDNALLGGIERYTLSLQKFESNEGFKVKLQCWLKGDSEKSITLEWFEREEKNYLTISFKYPEKRRESIFFDFNKKRCISTFNQKSGEVETLPFDVGDVIKVLHDKSSGMTISPLKILSTPESNPVIEMKFKNYPPGNKERTLILPQRLKILK
jgi:hypothetical protein